MTSVSLPRSRHSRLSPKQCSEAALAQTAGLLPVPTDGQRQCLRPSEFCTQRSDLRAVVGDVATKVRIPSKKDEYEY